MANDVVWMRELLALSLRAPDPQRSAPRRTCSNSRRLQSLLRSSLRCWTSTWLCPMPTERRAIWHNWPQRTRTCVFWQFCGSNTSSRLSGGHASPQTSLGRGTRPRARRVAVCGAARATADGGAALGADCRYHSARRVPSPVELRDAVPNDITPLRRPNGAVDLPRERRDAGKAAEQTNGEKTATIITALMTTGADQLNVLVTTTKLISRCCSMHSETCRHSQNGELIRSALVEFYNQLERLVKFRQAFLALVGDAGATDVEEAIQTLDKCMHRIAAIVVGVQNSYPMEFCEYLPPYLTLFWNVLNAFSSVHPTALPLPRRLQIEALQFFANVLSCRLYKNESLSGPDGTTRIITKVITATGDVALTDAMVLEAQAAVQTFFTQTENRFASMLNLVVMHYMTLTTKDLDEWHSDPEAYCTLMESLTAKESVRACAENVFLTLVQNFPDQTIPALTQITSSASTYLVELGRGQVSTGADRRVLEMDAVLLAIGLGCYDLHDCFEFEPWFLTNLVPILVNQDAAVGSFQGFPVMRFRIVWLVSCWLAQLSANVRPPLYDALLNPSASFHQADADVALKLRVIQTLESMVNDWGFEHDAFAPFLTRALECLFAFFPQADESESKMKVLGCLEAIIQGCGPQILMAKLLSSVKEAPSVETGSVQELLGMCVQVIRFATDVSNPDEVFLMESGLELWNETLEVSSVYTEELHQLFGNVLRLMERDYEHVALVLSLLEHYLRLGKAQFWQTYHTNVSGLLQSVIGNVKAEASLQIAQVTEIIVATVPIDQVPVLLPVVKTMVWALALCSTLMLIEQPVLEKTGQILEICVEVIEDEQEEKALKQAATANSDEDGARSGVYRAFQAHHKQQQAPSEEDAPILALDLKGSVCERLNDLAAKLGSGAFDQLLQTVDSSVLRKFHS
ncbi:Armadillo-type fold [Phytophthora cactorum]|nr:Armadillo-type fold [Phytophthora cactorum]